MKHDYTNEVAGQCAQESVMGLQGDYGNYRMPQLACDVIVIWVLRNHVHGGFEYLAGGPRQSQGLVPLDRMKDVIARIGPIAWEEGQGLEPFRMALHQGARKAEQFSADREQRQEMDSRIRDLLQRELDARARATETSPPLDVEIGKGPLRVGVGGFEPDTTGPSEGARAVWSEGAKPT